MNQEAFRYVPKDIVDIVLGGSIKVGTLSYYRHMEGERADEFEGSSLLKMPDQSFLAGVPRHEKSILEHLGILSIGENVGRFTFQGNRVRVNHEERYISCFTSEPNFEFARSRNLAVLRIANIKEHSDIVTAGSGGVLANPEVGEVRYSNLEGDLYLPGSWKMPNPFVKRTVMSWEREIRICWTPVNLHPEPTMIFDVPAVIATLERIL